MSALSTRTACAGVGLRLLRAAVFAAVCVVLAAAGHALASCASVPLWALGAGFAGTLLVVAPLAGRTRSLAGIAALLAVGQTALHTLFGLAQHPTAAAAGAVSAGTAGRAGPDAWLVAQAARFTCGTPASGISPSRAYRMLVDAHVYAGSAAHAPAVPRPALHQSADVLSAAGATASMVPSLPMLLGHLLAALPAGWLLRRGDLALLRLIELSAHGVAEAALVRALRGALALVRALCAGLPTGPAGGPRHARTTDSSPLAPSSLALQHSVIRRGPPAAAFRLAA
ncbi:MULTISPECIES: hypothetical protein [Streptomyces]|uniref:Integral membrane protein n=1 Tax=Streptomyces thermoviolaceus subsp. thermoviolaceus TaxID=66860 RepID=A0ABX0YUK4_STRTL|nr:MULTISPECIES: hypothetical protein [Streptomyces]WTD48516.1 hypothetical protein OG899_13845 [Streptomyces thermoviolaceus]NJP15783.1 hypothetical protein [Streptomyces thermoviolaceus subsp. thermoviolaceus]RSS07638.1 hypothetical protein EF917_04725 [Streptomyces sp. WAC00469]GGV73082.1 hypothetical protein GCM10010499_26320 [Streptomyces thermoviolaceus subsp. apingens]GHA89037.1 hypothetical protein GCM10010512_20710 [Streptomyces thermoviolaceus subsp. thermoviolaceus]